MEYGNPTERAITSAHTARAAGDEWVLEIGGGLNFERKQFLRLVDRIVSGEVERVVLAHQDRLVRFGYQLLAHLCHTHQTELVVMNTETLSPEQELVQDCDYALFFIAIGRTAQLPQSTQKGACR
jgi:predicted site-specific integrase-resolvase